MFNLSWGVGGWSKAGGPTKKKIHWKGRISKDQLSALMTTNGEECIPTTTAVVTNPHDKKYILVYWSHHGWRTNIHGHIRHFVLTPNPHIEQSAGLLLALSDLGCDNFPNSGSNCNREVKEEFVVILAISHFRLIYIYVCVCVFPGHPCGT
jgi:hypothetical protein